MCGLPVANGDSEELSEGWCKESILHYDTDALAICAKFSDAG